jgi:hypothetical protein
MEYVINIFSLIGAFMLFYYMRKTLKKDAEKDIKNKVEDYSVITDDINKLRVDLKEIKTFINGWDNYLFVMRQDVSSLKEMMNKKNKSAASQLDAEIGLEIKNKLSSIENHVMKPMSRYPDLEMKSILSRIENHIVKPMSREADLEMKRMLSSIENHIVKLVSREADLEMKNKFSDIENNADNSVSKDNERFA